MPFRSDITVDWIKSPRLIRVAAPSTEVVIQDLHDTLRRLEARPWEGLPFPKIVDTFGKQDLGGGVKVGLTLVLKNARLYFEARRASVESGTITTPDSTGVTLTDSTGLFVTNGVQPGAWVVNMTDGSVASVLTVVSETQLLTDGLGDGVDNQFGSGDAYEVRNVVQCEVSGGNIVALNSLGSPISSILPTAGTQPVRTSSSSATLQESSDIQFSSFDGHVSVDPTSAFSGTTYPVGTPRQPVNNLVDALAIGAARGIKHMHFLSDATLSSGDFQGLRISARIPDIRVTVGSAALTNGCVFSGLTLTGTLDGDVLIEDSLIEDLTYVDGTILRCALRGTITLSAAEDASVIGCWDDIAGVGTPTIDFGGTGSALIVREYRGGLVLRNKTGPEEVSLNLDGGRVVCDANFGGSGSVVAHGIGTVTNNGSAVIDQSRLVSPASIWDRARSAATAGSFGEGVRDSLRILDNRLEIDFDSQELVLYDDAGTVVLRRWPLDTDGGEDVATQSGAQTKRGKPQ